ncbi:hypothetical protein [uncultured Brevundimonas sp.]|uniref:hypothetical protein n=1 Tax=uncultured Brevundimonas sp. TaxID=213418 RepID=UPI0030EDE175|tara:strand:- start:1433 stop:1939 length:507 start_codon:yes stop_codon:yes gene_type:complete
MSSDFPSDITGPVPADAPLEAEVSVAGHRVEARTVAFSQFNFGRQSDPPLTTYPFVLVAEEAPFLHRFRPRFEQVMAELREDDADVGFEPLYEGATGHPSLDEMFTLPHDKRKRVLAAFFAFDILDMYVNVAGGDLQWVGMSLDDITMTDGELRIEGTVRRPVGWAPG